VGEDLPTNLAILGRYHPKVASDEAVNQVSVSRHIDVDLRDLRFMAVHNRQSNIQLSRSQSHCRRATPINTTGQLLAAGSLWSCARHAPSG
jgi:hypothetical protein